MKKKKWYYLYYDHIRRNGKILDGVLVLRYPRRRLKRFYRLNEVNFISCNNLDILRPKLFIGMDSENNQPVFINIRLQYDIKISVVTRELTYSAVFPHGMAPYTQALYIPCNGKSFTIEKITEIFNENFS